MTWQPIETAPKLARVLYYIDHDEGIFISGWVGPLGQSYTDDDGSRGEPTHWMPLPEPPK